MSDKNPIIKRDEAIRGILLGGTAIIFAILFVLSERPLIIGDRPWIMPGTPIAHDKLPPDYLHALDGYGVHQPKLRRRPLLAIAGGEEVATQPDFAPPDPATLLRLGYSIIETDILGMPFVFRKDDGHVIYYEDEHEFVYAPVTDDYFRQIHIAAPPIDSEWLPWWRQIWGWLFAIALIGAGIFELGAMRRRRGILGII